jgi:hypothetical protein
VVAAIKKVIHSWHDLPKSDAALLGGDTDINHHGAKFSVPVTVLYQLSWKFFVCLYLGFAALQPEHRLPTPSFCIRSWEGSSLPQSSVYVFKGFAMWNSARWILLPVFRHSSPTVSIAESVHKMHVNVFSICKHGRHFDYDCTATQLSHTSLDKV